MVNTAIRPNPFTELRFFVKSSGKWHTVNESMIGVDSFWAKTYKRSINIMLTGEKDCPIDLEAPKSRNDLVKGDKYWILASDDRWCCGIYIGKGPYPKVAKFKKIIGNISNIYFTTMFSNLIHQPSTDIQQPAVILNDYPHLCPNCNSPAYVGLNQIECSNQCV